MDKYSAILRIAKKAGTWYESNPSSLNEELSEYISKASKVLNSKNYVPKNIRAIICPHAGYTYSGSTAAFSFINLMTDQIKNIKNIFVLGPSHSKYFKGAKVGQCDLIQTPYGNLESDRTIFTELAKKHNFSELEKSVDENEHSLEMQYPYLYQSVYAYNYKPKVIPIMIGEINIKSAYDIAKELLNYFENDDNIFVVSSDFCHWGNNFDYKPYSGTLDIWQYIENLDKEGISYIQNKDVEGFASYLDNTQNTICGRNPILVLLSLISMSSNNINGKLLDYSQSSKVKSKNQSSVSYASIVFSKE